MNRRRALLGLTLPFLALGTAMAQEATPSRRPPRRASANDGAFMGGGMVVPSTPSFGTPTITTQRTELAPVPNSSIEAPRGFQQADAARITPSMIAPAIPGRGLAQANGSPGSLQDRLFRPSPGAHLRIPITSW